jgi:hypothetical protein
VPGSSLSIRLPTLVVWLSFGLRGPGAVGEKRLKRGVLVLEVAVPSWPVQHILAACGCLLTASRGRQEGDRLKEVGVSDLAQDPVFRAPSRCLVHRPPVVAALPTRGS